MKVYIIGEPTEPSCASVILAESPEEVANRLGGEFIPKEVYQGCLGVIRFKRELFSPPATEEEEKEYDGFWRYQCGPFYIVLLDSENEDWTEKEIMEFPWIASKGIAQALSSINIKECSVS